MSVAVCATSVFLADPAMSKRGLEREHQARTLKTRSESEPRISRSDEARITRGVREATDTERRDSIRAELAQLIAALSSADGLTNRYGRVVVGDHRSSLRAVDHHVRRLQAALRDLAGYL